MTLQSRFPATAKQHGGLAGGMADDDRQDIIDWQAVRQSPTEEVGCVQQGSNNHGSPPPVKSASPLTLT